MASLLKTKGLGERWRKHLPWEYESWQILLRPAASNEGSRTWRQSTVFRLGRIRSPSRYCNVKSAFIFDRALFTRTTELRVTELRVFLDFLNPKKARTGTNSDMGSLGVYLLSGGSSSTCASSLRGTGHVDCGKSF